MTGTQKLTVLTLLAVAITVGCWTRDWYVPEFGAIARPLTAAGFIPLAYLWFRHFRRARSTYEGRKT